MGSVDAALCSRKFNTFLQARFDTALVLKRTSARLWALVPITVAFIGDLLSEIIRYSTQDPTTFRYPPHFSCFADPTRGRSPGRRVGMVVARIIRVSDMICPGI